MIPAEGRQKLAKIPIYIVIGDRAQDRVEASRKFQTQMAPIGGQVTVDVLPEGRDLRERPDDDVGEEQQADHAPHDRVARRQRVQAQIAAPSGSGIMLLDAAAK